MLGSPQFSPHCILYFFAVCQCWSEHMWHRDEYKMDNVELWNQHGTNGTVQRVYRKYCTMQPTCTCMQYISETPTMEQTVLYTGCTKTTITCSLYMHTIWYLCTNSEQEEQSPNSSGCNKSSTTKSPTMTKQSTIGHSPAMRGRQW